MVDLTFIPGVTIDAVKLQETMTALSLEGNMSHPAQVRNISSVESMLTRMKNLRIEEYSQAIYIDPLAKPNLQAPDDKLFPLMDKVEGFLADDGQVMLILGDSGAGKSTFNRHLEQQLWKDYRPGGRIPLLINLPAIERPKNNLVVEQLRSYDFSEDHIWELKKHRQVLLICDGYDESQLNSNLHTTNLFNRPGQWSVKMLITCRSQYLGPDYLDRFMPVKAGEYFCTANELFQEALIAPFSQKQIEMYIEKYIPLEPRDWVKKDYMDKLVAIPNLMDLARNPFLLTIALETLPTVVQGRDDISRIEVTRMLLYDIFVTHWLSVNKRRILNKKLSQADGEAMEALLQDGFERRGITFQMNLGVAIFQKQDGRTFVEYVHPRHKSTWKARFFGFNPERRLLRESSLLSRVGNQYRFIHRSILEYFYSCAVWDFAKDKADFTLRSYSGSISSSFNIDNHPLSKKNLVQESSVIQFLAERSRMHTEFQRHLFALLDLSKSDPRASQAAANAITILVRAGTLFNGADLRGIRIPGADLTAGQFDSAQLQGSQLTGANFTRAWIRRTNFSRARMGNIQFGESPFLRTTYRVLSSAFSPDGTLLAVGLGNGDIEIYYTATWKIVRAFRGHQGSILHLTYSPSGEHLLSGGSDRTARLWSCETGLCVFVLEEHSNRVMAVAFSPSGRQVASASCDESVILWSTRTGAVDFVLRGHTDGVTGIAYLPRGTSISSCSWDGAVRVFDAQTGRPLLDSGVSDQRYCCLAYAPDGLRIISGSERGQLQFWESTDAEPGLCWIGHTGEVTGVDVSSNGQLIVSCGADNTVKLWNSYTARLISEFTGHLECVTSAVFSFNGAKIASTSWDETVRLWDVAFTGSGVGAANTSHPLTKAAYSPDGRFLVAYGAGMAKQYDAEKGEVGLVFLSPNHLHQRHQPVRTDCIAYSPDGRRIATAGFGTDVTVWHAHTGKAERILRGHNDKVTAIAFSPCHRWLASGSSDKTVRLWEATSGTPDRVFSGSHINSLAFSPDGNTVTAGSSPGHIWTWDTGTGKCEVLWYKDWTHCIVAYLPGSFNITSTDGEGSIVLRHKQTETSIFVLKQDLRITCFAYSSCGKWIATAHGPRVRIWEFAIPEYRDCVAAIDCFFGDVSDIVWRPNSLEFATTCSDGSIRAWRVMVQSNTVSVQQIWGTGCLVLAAPCAILVDALNLSTTNTSLLEQRGAILKFRK